MTFKLSPGLYVFDGDVPTLETFNDSPTAMVGSFRRGSLTPTRIRVGVNDWTYDLRKTNIEYGYGTIVAACAADQDNLVIKRVVSPDARSAEKSLMKYKNVSVYETIRYDTDHNVLEPVAIFLTSELTEDYAIKVTMQTSDGYGFVFTERYADSHNDTIKRLVEQIRRDLTEHNSNWQVSYDIVADPIQAIFIWQPYGITVSGTAEVYYDLDPMTLQEKIAVLDNYIANVKIALEDRALLIGILSLQVFYKPAQVEAFLDQWAKEHYLSPEVIADRIVYYIAQIMLTQDAVNPFYAWLNGRQNILKVISQLDDLLEQFKPTYYLTEQQIRDIIDAQVGIIITAASVDRVIDQIFIPKNWLYSDEAKVIAELKYWAAIYLVTDAQKRAWVNQYISMGKIRTQDFNDALAYVNVPLDDTIALQALLDEYCELTYMTQAEKAAIIWAHVSIGDITAEEVPIIQDLVSYLIRKDESYLVDEAIMTYIGSKYLTLPQINLYVDQLIAAGKLLEQDRADFMTYLINDPVLTYYYKTIAELDAKFDQYADLYYITKAEADALADSYVNILISLSDANEIKASITTQYTREELVMDMINAKAGTYMTQEDIYNYVSQADIRHEDIPTVVDLFDGELISKDDTDYIDDKIDEWKQLNYMQHDDIIAITERYDENQTLNQITLLSPDAETFYQSITEHILKGDDGRVVELLQQWARDFYVSQAVIDDVWNDAVATGQIQEHLRIEWEESTYYPPAGLFRNRSEVVESLEAFSYASTAEQMQDYIEVWRQSWSPYDYDLLTSITLYESDGTKTGYYEAHDRMYIIDEWIYDSVTDTETPQYRPYASYDQFVSIMESYPDGHLEFENVMEMLEIHPIWSTLANNQKLWLFNMIWYNNATVPTLPDQHRRWIYGTEEDLTSRITALVPDLPPAEWELSIRFRSRQLGSSLDFGDGQVTHFYVDAIDYMDTVGRIVLNSDGTEERFDLPVPFVQGTDVSWSVTTANDAPYPQFFIGDSTTPVRGGTVTIDGNTTLLIEVDPTTPYMQFITKDGDEVVTQDGDQMVFKVEV